MNKRTIYLVDHGLRGSAVCNLTGDGACQHLGREKSTHLNRSPKKFVAADYIGDPYNYAKFETNSSTGASVMSEI